MRVPTSLLTDLVNVTRRQHTGAGVIDTPLFTDLPCRVESTVKVTPTTSGPVSQQITTIYLRPVDVRTGDHVTLPTGDTVEVRQTATHRGAGSSPVIVTLKCW